METKDEMEEQRKMAQGIIDEHSARIKVLEAERDAALLGKDDAYAERNELVCALSKLLPSYLARHPEQDTEWEDDWRWIVFIDAPAGQLSWHLHDSQMEHGSFAHLEQLENVWDGHDTVEKYERLAALGEQKA